jgi:hypothetical protein
MEGQLAKMDGCFRRTCKVVLQDEVGELREFDGFLRRYIEPLRQTNSGISGKKVYYSEPYCEGAKFLSLDEIEKMKTEPFHPSEIKDIEGLLNAMHERFCYAGNKIMGNSQDVVESESCVDAVHVLQSHQVFNCEYIVYCQMVIDSKFLFGCSWGGENNFCINTSEMYKAARCFESAFVINSRDVYFSYNCRECNEAMFCFNQFSKNYSIGNSQLPRDKYGELKKKLIGEIVEILKKRKTVPSLVELSAEVW